MQNIRFSTLCFLSWHRGFSSKHYSIFMKQTGNSCKMIKTTAGINT